MALVASPKVLGGALTVALNAVLLKFLTPADYGAYALCITAIMLSDGVIGSAIDNTMLKLVQVQPDVEGAHAGALEKAALLLKAALWLAGSLLVLPLAAPMSRRAFQQDGRASLVALALFGAGTVLLFRSLLAHWQVRRRFREYSRLDLLHVLLKFGSVGALLLAAARPSVEMLVLLIGVAPLAVVALAASRSAFPIPWVRTGRAELAEVGQVAKWFLVTYGISALIGRLDLLCLAEISRIEEVGMYAGGQVFAMIPDMLGSYVAVVLAPRLMGYWREGVLRRLLKALLLWGGALSLLLVAASWLARPALTALFPPAFRPSSQVFLILLPGSLAAMLAFPLAIPFLMFAQPRRILLIDLWTLPVVAGLLVALTARYGAAGAAWAATLSRLGKIALIQWAAWRILNREPPARPEALAP